MNGLAAHILGMNFFEKNAAKFSDGNQGLQKNTADSNEYIQ